MLQFRCRDCQVAVITDVPIGQDVVCTNCNTRQTMPADAVAPPPVVVQVIAPAQQYLMLQLFRILFGILAGIGLVLGLICMAIGFLALTQRDGVGLLASGFSIAVGGFLNYGISHLFGVVRDLAQKSHPA